MSKQRRIEFHELLCNVLGTRYAYFQPPESIKMKYPCIVYAKSSGRPTYADNNIYTFKQGYDVTVIDPDPDSSIPKSLMETFSYIQHDREYIADNLHHSTFTIYY